MAGSIITKTYIKALATKMGIPRVQGEAYPVIQSLTETYLSYILKESFEFTRHRKAATLTANDIQAAIKRTT